MSSSSHGRSLFVIACTVVLGAAGAARAGADGPPLTRPAVPPAIAAPAEAKLTTKVHAVGVQVYVCAAPAAPAAPAAGKPAWTLKHPDAKLFDASGAAIGVHGAGPSWTAKDGSSITGKKAADAAAPSPTAIPWLLITAVSNTGTGVFGKVTYVQRANTSGGKAPAAGCDATTLGAEKRVDYNADYYFFEGAAAITPRK